MKKIKTEDGYNMEVLSDIERNSLLSIITKDIPTLKEHKLPSGFKYKMISENDQDYDNIIVMIETKGIRKTIKGNVCNIEDKISKAVNKINRL